MLGLAAVGLAWLHYERLEVAARRAAYVRFEKKSARSTGWNMQPWADDPTRPAWLRGLTGDDLPGELHAVTVHDATRDDFIALQKFPELRQMFVSGPKFTRGEVELRGLSKLETLAIWTDECPGDSLECLKDTPRLINLKLMFETKGDPGLEHLREVRRLVHLELSGPIEEEELVHLASLRELETLDLSGAEVTDRGIALLPELRNLRSLRLNKSHVTSEGLGKLNMPKLESLDLRGCRRFRDEDARVLQRFPLRSLSLGPYITDAAVEHLLALKQLDFLFLNQTHLSDGALERLEKAFPNASITQATPPEPFPAPVP